MSGPAYLLPEEEALLNRFIRLTDAYRVLHPYEPQLEGPIFQGDAGNFEVPQGALGGAKAVLAALFLESYALLSVFIVWHYFLLFR